MAALGHSIRIACTQLQPYLRMQMQAIPTLDVISTANAANNRTQDCHESQAVYDVHHTPSSELIDVGCANFW